MLGRACTDKPSYITVIRSDWRYTIGVWICLPAVDAVRPGLFSILHSADFHVIWLYVPPCEVRPGLESRFTLPRFIPYEL